MGWGGVLISRIAAVLRPLTLTSLQCREGACRVLTDQADIVRNERSAVRCSASRMKGELHPTKNHL